MKADLHLHTVFSDGLLSPEEVAKKAREAGLDLVCFTDHDTLSGWEEKRAAAQKYGLKTTQGWEVSAYLNDVKIHVLGYGCKQNDAYTAYRAKQKEGALLRFLDMTEKANKQFGLSLTLDDILAQRLNENAALHTMHVVRAFAERVKIPFGELYLQNFTVGKPCYSSLNRPTPEQAINIIHQTGGIAVLAHPGRISLQEEELKKLTDILVEQGLNGIECYYTTHTFIETEKFLQYARERKLLVSGGSDFHLQDEKHLIGKPDFYPDSALLAAISPF